MYSENDRVYERFLIYLTVPMEPAQKHLPDGITLFSWITGALFLMFGVLNFFMTAPVDLQLKSFHASLHVLLGCAGLLLPRHRRTFAVTVTAIGLVLSMLGFAGITDVPGLITLNGPLNYAYGVIGIIGLLLVIARPTKAMPAAVPQ
jgi:hypothetical protein